ncbi:hypothetical protein E4T52_00874 [Aureobasidium sp. EXF-3400]|nr:hypothetical protein E4T51_00671 [Aureobasidium sp. EXF-12344]KAI4784199.1 hypothetical protein E4T52_00874 [Aureobasidium sp. EXF-3400]
MCGRTTMIYQCPCGKLSRDRMPPRNCSPACEIKKDDLTIELTRPCEDCYNADMKNYDKLHHESRERPTTHIYDKPLPGIPGPGPAEGLPPTYYHATEQPPKYVQAIAEEQPVSYEKVMMAITTFQPEEIVRAWHTFNACQLSLLPPLLDELLSRERRVVRAKRHLHRAEDIGFCEEVMIRLTREQKSLDASLQQGQRYLDATLVLKYGLDKYRTAARAASKAGDYEQARRHVKAASEHADRLLEMKIQLSRPEQQPRVLEGIARQQLYLLEKVVQTLEARTTSRVWTLLQVATRADYDTHC